MARDFFFDPVLRGPTWGCILLGSLAGLVGSLAFVRRRSLLGEVLSHASYPGVALALVALAALEPWLQQRGVYIEQVAGEAASLGALIFAAAGWGCMRLLERAKVSSDTALCATLSAFLGIGVLLASRLQFTHPFLYRQVQNYIYGQAATLTDFHIALFGILLAFAAAVIFFFYKEIQIVHFDSTYAKTIGVRTRFVEAAVAALTLLAVVVGIRGGGIVLMASLMIAPVAAARQLTWRLSPLLFLSALIGAFCGWLGNVFSVWGQQQLELCFMQKMPLPTGPSIALVASAIALLALIFAPSNGFFFRYYRTIAFRCRCIEENLLKAIWRAPGQRLLGAQLVSLLHLNPLGVHLACWHLQRQGWLEKRGSPRERGYGLTGDGLKKAAHIVRLHRLWEVYLADHLGMGAAMVHPNAEEMEHILTPELERALTALLRDPKVDPHSQPIPKDKEL